MYSRGELMKRFKLLVLTLGVVLLTSCSFAEPSNDTTYLYIPTENGTWEHAINHQLAGADELSLLGLSGLLADDQHVIDSEVVSAIEAEAVLTLNNLELNDWVDFEGAYGFRSDDIISFQTYSTVPFYMRAQNNSPSGIQFLIRHRKNPPANGDFAGMFQFSAYNSSIEYHDYAQIRIIQDEVTTDNESSSIEWYMINDGSWNTAMMLDSNGTLLVDDSYGTFDIYDDALVLKDGISGGNKELMRTIGVIKEIPIIDIDGKILGYHDMIQLQPFTKLVAGGVYQNRDKIDELEARIDELEKLIK